MWPETRAFASTFAERAELMTLFLFLLNVAAIGVAGWQHNKRNYFFSGLAWLLAPVPFMIHKESVEGVYSLMYGLFGGLAWGQPGKKGE